MGSRWRAVSGSKSDPEYNIIASDILMRIGHDGGSMSTGHIWGGDRDLNPPSYATLKYRSWTGVADVNYSFDDGHVESRPQMGWQDISGPSTVNIPSGGGQGGDHYCLPIEWGE